MCEPSHMYVRNFPIVSVLSEIETMNKKMKHQGDTRYTKIGPSILRILNMAFYFQSNLKYLLILV